MKKFIKGFIKLVGVISAIAAIAACIAFIFERIEEIKNKGIELALNAALVRSKDFNLNMNLTYNLNFNKVDKLNEAFGDEIRYGTNWGSSALMPGDDYIIKVGEPVGLVRGYTSNGFYTLDDFDYTGGKYVLKAGIPDITDPGICVTYPKGSEWDAAVPQGQYAFPGCIKLEDIDGDGKVDTGDKLQELRLQRQLRLSARWQGV